MISVHFELCFFPQGGALFGTKRTLPKTDAELSACAENIAKFGIQGLVILGGEFSSPNKPKSLNNKSIVDKYLWYLPVLYNMYVGRYTVL